MIEIQLTQGKVALIDDEDYDLISQHKWYASGNDRRGFGTKTFIYSEDRKRKLVTMSQMLMKFPELEVDHIDRNGLNNQKSNLRLATRSQNCANRSKAKGKSSKYRGVALDKTSGRWSSCIKINRKRIYLGYFTSEEDAALAYNEKAVELFGEFAGLNIIERIPE